MRALTHALDTGRLHHAYLFSGTRGVGKTTIARILAKAVNCETGISSRPCGHCAACVGVDAGRYPDYIEMDAASNRRVEEMTVLLENAAYAPSLGRYKVFVIDEVSRDYGDKLSVAKVNIDENQEIAQKYNIRGIPTLMLFRNGAVVATKVGALSKSQLTAFLDSNL